MRRQGPHQVTAVAVCRDDLNYLPCSHSTWRRVKCKWTVKHTHHQCPLMMEGKSGLPWRSWMMPRDCWEGGVLRETQCRVLCINSAPGIIHVSLLPGCTNHHKFKETIGTTVCRLYMSAKSTLLHTVGRSYNSIQRHSDCYKCTYAWNTAKLSHLPFTSYTFIRNEMGSLLVPSTHNIVLMAPLEQSGGKSYCTAKGIAGG